MARAQWFYTLEDAKKGAKGRPVHSVQYVDHVGVCYFAGEPPAYVQRGVEEGEAQLKKYVCTEGKWAEA